MSTNDNPTPDPTKSARGSSGADRPQSMKERLLADRNKAQAAGGAPAPSTTPANSTPPSSTPRPVPASAPARPAAAKPAAAATPKPAAAPAARPVAAKPAATGAARTPSSAERHLHKPIPGADPNAPVHPDIKRELNLLRERESKTMMIAWIVCGVLVLGAGGWFLYVTGVKRAEQQLIDDKLALDAAFLKKMESFDVKTEQGATDAIGFAAADVLDGKKVSWQQSDKIAGKITTIVSASNATLQSLADSKYFNDRLAAAEAVASNAASKTPDEVVRARRTVKELSDSSDAQTDEVKKRIATMRLQLEKVYVQRLWDDGKTQAAGGPANFRAALSAYGKAEQACLDLFEKKIPDPTGELQTFARPILTQIYTESDALCAQLFTPEYINQQPWTDLLSGEMAAQWQDSSLNGFRIEGGVLQAVGPDANSGKEGLVSIPKINQWRDVQIELEFELVTGRSQFYMRLLRRADNAVEGPRFSSKEEENYVLAKSKVGVVITAIGNKLMIAYTGGAGNDETKEIRANLTRKGGFGASVPPGTELKIHKARARILRTETN